MNLRSKRGHVYKSQMVSFDAMKHSSKHRSKGRIRKSIKYKVESINDWEVASTLMFQSCFRGNCLEIWEFQTVTSHMSCVKQ